MTEELKNHIERIRSLSPKLNEATDQAAAIVDRVEKFLSDECSVGITARVRFTDAVEREAPRKGLSETLYLVYERIAGKFRVGVAVEWWGQKAVNFSISFLTPERIKREVTAWPSVDRETKLAAFEKLPEVLQEIAEKTEKATASVGAAAKSAEAILKALSTATPQPAAKVVDVEITRPPALKPGEEQVVTSRYALLKVGEEPKLTSRLARKS
ncbi:MAG: hypothetical protein V1790_06020 [Planctomycetota bacterium]